MGTQVADAMEGQVGRFDDPELASYVDTIARRVEAEIPNKQFQFQFAILDQPEPNAFAAPGGFVYVSRGLLALAQSEDEVAGVLGHEITHVEERHTAEQLSRQTLPSLLTLPGRAVGSILSPNLGNLINAPIDGLGAIRQASYGRGQEEESDEIGQQLAAAAGYDPVALGAILDRMEQYVEVVTGDQRRPSFFDTHPPTPNRVSDIERRAQGLSIAPRPAGALDDNDFLQRLDGLVYGANPAQGEFRDEMFLHPDLDIALTFPSGWDTVNTAEMAGAIAPSKDNFVFYGVAGRGGSDEVERLAAESRRDFERQAGLRPSEDEPRDVSGKPAHLLVYTDRGGREPIHLFFVWLATDGVVHQLVGIAPESLRSTMRATVESLRSLTDAERDSFEVHRIRVVAARAGESLAELGRRTENTMDPGTTAVVNGLNASQPLTDGQLLKIVRRESYRPDTD